MRVQNNHHAFRCGIIDNILYVATVSRVETSHQCLLHSFPFKRKADTPYAFAVVIIYFSVSRDGVVSPSASRHRRAVGKAGEVYAHAKTQLRNRRRRIVRARTSAATSASSKTRRRYSVKTG